MIVKGNKVQNQSGSKITILKMKVTKSMKQFLLLLYF